MGHSDALEERAADTWLERRHPGLDPGDETAPRVVVHGDPRECGDAEEAARVDEPAPLPEIPLSPGHCQRHAPALHRRRYRTVAHGDAAPPESPPGRGERDGVAEDPQRHV